MENTEFVTLQSFDHRVQADMLLLLLHQQDIPARLTDEHLVAMKGMLANAIGGIKVQVPAMHESQALEIAMQFQADARTAKDRCETESDDDFCLSCGTKISEIQTRRGERHHVPRRG